MEQKNIEKIKQQEDRLVKLFTRFFIILFLLFVMFGIWCEKVGAEFKICRWTYREK